MSILFYHGIRVKYRQGNAEHIIYTVSERPLPHPDPAVGKLLLSKVKDEVHRYSPPAIITSIETFVAPGYKV